MRRLMLSLALAAIVITIAAPAFAQEVLTVSGSLKKWNNNVVAKFDRETGDMLVVWSQGDVKKNLAGAIYAALLTNNGGNYTLGEPFKVSTGTTGQRPSCIYLPATEQWLIAWDNGPRDILAELDLGAAPAGGYLSAGLEYRTFHRDSGLGQPRTVFNQDFLYGFPELCQYQAVQQMSPPVGYDWVFMAFSCIRLDGGGIPIHDSGQLFGQTFAYGSNGSYFSGVQKPILNNVRGYVTGAFVNPDHQIQLAFNDIVGETLPEKEMHFRALRVEGSSANLLNHRTVYQRPEFNFNSYADIFPIDGKKALTGFTTYSGADSLYGLYSMPRLFNEGTIPAGPHDILPGAMVYGSIGIVYDRDPTSLPLTPGLAPAVKASTSALVFRLGSSTIALRGISVKGKPVGSRVDLATSGGLLDYDADAYGGLVAAAWSEKVSKKNSRIKLRIVPIS